MFGRVVLLIVIVAAAEALRLLIATGGTTPVTAELTDYGPALAVVGVLQGGLLAWQARRSRFPKGQAWVMLFAVSNWPCPAWCSAY